MSKQYSTAEAARKCKVSQQTILAWAQAHNLGRRTDERGTLTFSQDDLAKMRGKRPLASKGDYVFAVVMGERAHMPLVRNLYRGDQFAKVRLNGRSFQVKARAVTLV